MGAQKIELVQFHSRDGGMEYAIHYRDFYCPVPTQGTGNFDFSLRYSINLQDGELWYGYQFYGREVSDTTKLLFLKTAIEGIDYFRDNLEAIKYKTNVVKKALELYSYNPSSKTKSSTTKSQVKGTEETMGNETMDLLRELKEAIGAMNTMRTSSPLEEKLLEAVIERTKEIATAELEAELRVNLDKFIQNTYGSLPKRLDVKIADNPTKHLSGLFHKKYEDILRIVANNIPVMLTGSAGTGKNFTLEQVAEALGLEFYYTGAITQEYKLTGFIDAGGTYHETEFYKAFKNGGVFMLDEVDASSAETLVILNGAIANRYFDFPNGRIKAHDDFRIVCAGNTFGTGADMVYVGRNVLDGATLDRFAVIKMDYDLVVESQLCPDSEFHEFIKDMRKLVNKLSLRHIVGMRASINGYRALQAGLDKAFVIESIVLKGLGLDDIQTLVSNLSGSEPDNDWYSELRNYSRRLKKGAQ